MGLRFLQLGRAPFDTDSTYHFPLQTESVPQSFYQPQMSAVREPVVEAQLQLPLPGDRLRRYNEREEFFIFVKILFRLMAKSNKKNGQTSEDKLRQRAKSVVSECTRRNRLGDTDYVPLVDAIEQRLRPTVGERNWALAKTYLYYYIQEHGFRREVVLPPAISTVL